MGIIRHTERSGPIYRERAGRVVSYVVERRNMAIRLGSFRLRLPSGRRVFVIDEAGVRTMDGNSPPLLPIALIAVALALLASRRSPKRDR